jgi:hypothetical protein
MKSKLKRPFRAPRKAVDRSKGGKGADQLDAAIEEATALGLGWKPLVVKETQYPEVEPVGRDQRYVRLDSITETGDEYEAKMDKEQLADTLNGCKLTLKMVEALGDEHAYPVRGALPDTGKGVTLVTASPNLSEFETLLDGCDRDFASNTAKKKKAMTKAKNKEDSDESDDLETLGISNCEHARSDRRCRTAAVQFLIVVCLHLIKIVIHVSYVWRTSCLTQDLMTTMFPL